LAINLGHVAGELDQTVGVAPLVVVPGNELDESVVESDAGLHIQDGGVRFADEILGDDLILGQGEDTLHWALRGGLDGGDDLVHGGGLLELAGKIDDGDIGGGNAEGHTGQLAVEGRDDLADGLGGAGARGDDVAASATATTPVLATAGRTIDGELGGGHSMNRCHKTLSEAEIVVDDLCQGGEAIGGARGVGHDLLVGGVLLVVDAHDEHLGVVLRGGRDDDLLASTLRVEDSFLACGEDSGRLADVVGTGSSPGNFSGVLGGVDVDDDTVDYEIAVLGLDGAVESAVDGIVLEEVDHVVEIHEGVVDGHNLDVFVLGGGAEHQAANAAKSVNSHLNRHDEISFCFF